MELRDVVTVDLHRSFSVEKKRASEAPRRKKQRQPKMSREPVPKLVPVTANFGEEAALENANELELVQCRGEVAAMLQYVHRFCQLHKSKQDPSTMLVRRCQPLQIAFLSTSNLESLLDEEPWLVSLDASQLVE
ncbi:hypothetical protein F2Q69_00002606 [Brassica cretica]|uniref:Uncharacterized protein n=1 Tax=Brassica cretica TaxID=69181 RepID=A0A8S9PE17_BRACR|nr:hypothetical protein F2Q69_00002606 [Brassica cretica]